MPQHHDTNGQPRRTFLATLVAGVSGAAALLSRPRRVRAASTTPTVPATGPVLYRRTAETERYYRTLYR